MKFNEIKYARITLDEVETAVNSLSDSLSNATTPKEAVNAAFKYFRFLSTLSTSTALCYTRHTINTKDAFYAAEQDYYDETTPLMQKHLDRANGVFLNCAMKDALTESIGELFFTKLENEKKLFNESIIPDLQEENRLESVYRKLIGSAKLNFDGKELNLAEILPYCTDENRDVRRRATETYYGYFSDNGSEFDEIYDSLVKVRDRIAKKLGFESYVDMSFCTMERFDYTPDMVRTYRNEVKKHLVPLVSKLKEAQRKRLDYDELYFYDLEFSCRSGNPVPKGTPQELVEKARKMYHELSEESGKFFDYMTENGLMDLLAKPGKTNGGYCITFDSLKVPFIFANFNGTKDDVEVLTHEAGHALQGYLSMAETEVPAYINPSLDACEIHSMSMELITRPWMESFFGDDTEKFLYFQLESILCFIPYGCLVDEFQEHIYRNPDMTPDERKQLWLRLEKEYQPHINYNGIEFLESGGRWQRQSHIYTNPFYYIDYTLAQVCAVAFLIRFEKKDENAWSDYLNLCKAGGTKTFLSLVKGANLPSPFEKGVLADTIKYLTDMLDRIDDSKF